MTLLKTKGKTKAATSIATVFEGIVTSGLNEKAGVILEGFVRNQDIRLTRIASLNNDVKALEADKAAEEVKLKAAKKVTNQLAITRTMATIDADIMVVTAEISEIEGLLTAAAAKRDAFIKAFDTDAYAALADEELTRGSKKIPSCNN